MDNYPRMATIHTLMPEKSENLITADYIIAVKYLHLPPVDIVIAGSNWT